MMQIISRKEEISYRT